MLTFSSYFFFLNFYFWTKHPKISKRIPYDLLPSAMLTCSSPSFSQLLLSSLLHFGLVPCLLALLGPFVSIFVLDPSPSNVQTNGTKEDKWIRNISKPDDQLPSLRTTTAQKPSLRHFSKPNMNRLPILGEHIIQAQEFSESNWSKAKNCGWATSKIEIPRIWPQGARKLVSCNLQCFLFAHTHYTGNLVQSNVAQRQSGTNNF